jgi:hypothetical protein
MSDSPEVDAMIRQLATMPGSKLPMTLQALLDRPLDPQGRQRLLRSLDGLAERVDRLVSLAESPNADWRSGRRDLAETRI